MKRLLRCVALGSLLLGSCSLPTDETAQPIAPEQLPDSLRSDLTTTTTTIEPPLAVPVGIFLIDLAGEREIVIEVIREVETTASLFDRLALLFGDEVRSNEDVELGYTNPVGEFTLTSAERNENDIAIIDIVALDEDGNPITVGRDVLRNVAAQLVYTATGFNAIRGVRILIDGERVVLPTTDEQGDTEEVVTRADYDRYDPLLVVTTTTVPESTTTTDPDAPTTTQAGD